MPSTFNLRNSLLTSGHKSIIVERCYRLQCWNVTKFDGAQRERAVMNGGPGMCWSAPAVSMDHGRSAGSFVISSPTAWGPVEVTNPTAPSHGRLRIRRYSGPIPSHLPSQPPPSLRAPPTPNPQSSPPATSLWNINGVVIELLSHRHACWSRVEWSQILIRQGYYLISLWLPNLIKETCFCFARTADALIMNGGDFCMH